MYSTSIAHSTMNSSMMLVDDDIMDSPPNMVRSDIMVGSA